MVNKGIQKLWKKFTGGREKPVEDSVDAHLKQQTKITEDRIRELNMAKLLTDVELSLDSSSSKLSKAKIDEIGIRSVLKRARYELVEHPVMTEQDLGEIHACIKYIIHEVGRAVELGYETSAHWSTVALATATETLLIPITGNDEEYADALMKERRKYARNLKRLTQNALAYDEYTTELNQQTKRYAAKEADIDKSTAAVQAVLDSERGPWLCVNIRDNANDVSKMHPDAKKLRDDMRDLHMKEADLIGFALAVNAASENQTLYAKEIDQCRNHIAIFPRVTDPTLAAKNQDAADQYVNELRKRLNRAEAGMKAIASSLSQLMNLGTHSIFQTGTTEALDMLAELQMRKVREKEAQLEAAKSAIRDKEQAKIIKRVEDELTRQLNILAQEDEEEVHTAEQTIDAQLQEATEELNQPEEEFEDEDEDLLIEDAD